MSLVRQRASQDAIPVSLQAAALRAAANAIVITDTKGAIVWVNPAFTRLTGYAFEEVRGKNPRILKSGEQDDAFYADLWQTISRGDTWYGELKNRRKDGTTYVQDFTITPVRDADGTITNYIGVGQDITDRKRLEGTLAHQATHDALTGLPNRILLRDRAEQALALARRTKKIVALLFIDLDDFKLVNDTLGHDAGDRLLRMTGQRLSLVLRAGDTVARTGGDEFVALIPSVPNIESAVEVAHKLLDALRIPMDIDGHAIPVHASVGIAYTASPTDDFETLQLRADAALYRAKSLGRGAIELCTPQLQHRMMERQLARTRLEHAVRRGDFHVHFQPIVRTASREVVGAEALARWRGLEGAEALPDAFIPLAEETRLIIPLGAAILQAACAEAAQWPQVLGRRMRISVNLSPKQFLQPNLLHVLEQTIADAKLPPELLEVEITEAAAIDDDRRARRLFDALRMRGIGIALDDFGTGYSSLSYLRKFPITTLKIDRSFSATVTGESRAIVEAIISMARSLQIRTVAEGVETEEQLAVLEAMQCDEVQGFLTGAPEHADAFRTRVAGAPRPKLRRRTKR